MRGASISARSRRPSAALQPLLPNFSAFVAVYGQYAFTPLLVSEQCSYGGRFFGRAFDPSQLLGDHCWAALGELRYDIMTPWKQLTRLQTYAFADHGEILQHQPGGRARRCRRAAPRSAPACAPHGKRPTRPTSRSRRRSKGRATTGVPSSFSARSIRENGPMRLRHLLLISTALMPLSFAAHAGPDGARVVGGSATVSGAGSRQRHGQPVQRQGDHQLADVRHRRRREDDVRAAEQQFDRAQSRHRQPGPVADPRQPERQRQGVRRQSATASSSAPARSSTRPASSRPPATSATKTSWRAASTSRSRAGRTPRSSTWERSRRRAAASRRWSRRACATPAPSRPISAASRSAPAISSRSISTATS